MSPDKRVAMCAAAREPYETWQGYREQLAWGDDERLDAAGMLLTVVTAICQGKGSSTAEWLDWLAEDPTVVSRVPFGGLQHWTDEKAPALAGWASDLAHYIETGDFRPVARTVRIHALFARGEIVDGPEILPLNRSGVSARLRLEMVAGGTGLLYPHPRMRYVPVHGAFTNSILRALTACREQGWLKDHDVRWVIEDQKREVTELGGASMGGNFLVCLAKLLAPRDDPLSAKLERLRTDKFAVTAQIVSGLSLRAVNHEDTKLHLASQLGLLGVVLGQSLDDEEHSGSAWHPRAPNVATYRASTLTEAVNWMAYQMDAAEARASGQAITATPIAADKWVDLPLDGPSGELRERALATEPSAHSIDPMPPKSWTRVPEHLLEKGRDIVRNPSQLPLNVHGKAGTGKSEFVRALIQEASGYNVFWIDLPAADEDPAEPDAVRQIAEAIAWPLRWYDVLIARGQLGRLTALRQRLSGIEDNHLIVIDNCDSLDAHAAAAVLAREVTTKIVVLSRAPLDLGTRLRIQGVGECAWQVFKEASQLDSSDESFVRRLLDLLGGHPLAIRLMAGIVRVESRNRNQLIAELAVELERRFNAAGLTGELWGRNTESCLEIAFRVARDFAIDSVHEPLLAALGTFSHTGAPAEALRSVSGAAKREDSFRSYLKSLENMNFVEATPGNGKVRMHVRLHEALRREVVRSLEASGDRPFAESMIGRMVGFYSRYAREHKERTDALDAERENLLQAVDWARRYAECEEMGRLSSTASGLLMDLFESLDDWLDITGDFNRQAQLAEAAIVHGRRLVAAIAETEEEERLHRTIQLSESLVSRANNFCIHDRPAEGLNLAEQALAAVEQVRQSDKAAREADQALASALGTVGQLQCEVFGHWFEGGLGNLRRALKLAEEVRSWAQAAFCAYQLGGIYEQRGAQDTARVEYEHAIELADRDPEAPEALRTKAYALTAFGRILAQTDPARARSYLEQGLEIKKKCAGPYSEAISLTSMAELEARTENHDCAREYCDQAAGLYLRAGLPASAGRAYANVARALYESDRPEDAYHLCSLGIGCVDKEADPGAYAFILHDLGSIQSALGQWPEAERCYREALGFREKARDTAGSAITHRALGVLYEGQERYPQALEAYQESLRRRDPERDPQSCGVVEHDIGDVYRAQDQWGEARDAYARAAALKRQGDDRQDLAVTLRRLGEAELELGNKEVALSTFDEEIDIHESLGQTEGYSLAAAHVGITQLLTEKSMNAEALEHGLAARGALEQADGAKPLEIAAVLDLIAAAQEAMDQDDEAAGTREEARKIVEGATATAFATGDPDALFMLGAYHQSRRELDVAQSVFEQAETALAAAGESRQFRPTASPGEQILDRMNTMRLPQSLDPLGPKDTSPILNQPMENALTP